MKIFFRFSLLLAFSLNGKIHAQDFAKVVSDVKTSADIKTGAQQTEKYLPAIKGQRVAVVGNQTSLIGKTHLVDSLLKLGIDIRKIFSPEHGFRGTEDAGEDVKTHKDKKTGLLIISLYGKDFKPKAADLADVDVVLFDIQDVGVRFYTYISTLHYVMEACAENKKQLVVLDRPNPNGYFIDGPVLEEKQKSFVGLHSVPIVYGMTIGEYAMMINSEGWLSNKVQCGLLVVPLSGYAHGDYYELPVKPSPNLPEMGAVYLYPSLCLFEGTYVSMGRGTDKPFQVFGYPDMPDGQYTFTPRSIKNVSENPLYLNKECKGFDVSSYGQLYMKYYKKLYLFWILNTYKTAKNKTTFFNSYFNQLAGNETLQQQIKDGKTEDEIRKTWQPAIAQFKLIRKKYLLYKDFE